MPLNCDPETLFHPERFPVYGDWIPPFSLDGSAFDAVSAWHMAKLSQLAYCDKETIEGELRKAGFELHASLSIESTHGFIAYNRRYVVLAFRGTDAEDWNNIRTDSDFLFTTHLSAEVHRGFSAALDLVWEGVLEALVKLKGRQVAYTGHSLGGALAILAASRLRPEWVYTFGAPKVGDSDFSALLEDVALFRVENCCDIVPNVPPLWLGYADPGKHIFLTEFGELLPNPPFTTVLQMRGAAELRYAARLPLFQSKTLLYRFLADHSILNYCDALEALLGHNRV